MPKLWGVERKTHYIIRKYLFLERIFNLSEWFFLLQEFCSNFVVDLYETKGLFGISFEVLLPEFRFVLFFGGSRLGSFGGGILRKKGWYFVQVDVCGGGA